MRTFTCTAILVVAITMLPGLVAAEPATEIESKLVPMTESCTWVESVDCSSCKLIADCWILYGWDRRLGKQCTITLTEYCDGLPTGNQDQTSYFRCSC